jgi:hypothetical protein
MTKLSKLKTASQIAAEELAWPGDPPVWARRYLAGVVLRPC